MSDFITRGEFDMSGPDGVILPEFWEDSVEPGMEIRMRPWVTIPTGGSSRSTFFTASSTSDGMPDEDDAVDHSPSLHQDHSERKNDGDSDESHHTDSSDPDAMQPHVLETITESGEDASDNVGQTPASPTQLLREKIASETESLGRRSIPLRNEYSHIRESVPMSQPPPPLGQTIPPIVEHDKNSIFNAPIEQDNESIVNVDLEEQVVEIPDKKWPSSSQNTDGLWRLDVLAARVTKGSKDTGDGSISTRLMTRAGPPKDSPREDINPDWHWLYVTSSLLHVLLLTNVNSDTFNASSWTTMSSWYGSSRLRIIKDLADYPQAFALTSPNIDSDLQKITWALLQEAKNRITNLPEGKSITPGTVIRYQAKRQQNKQKGGRQYCSATFVAFPYLDASRPARLNPMRNNELHPPRSLFNALYSWETIYNHSRQQIYTRFLKDSAGKIICVPCIWALQIDDSTSAHLWLNFQLTLRAEYLVTCGMVSHVDIFKMCSIQEECITPTIRFVDNEGRVILRHTNAYSSLLV